jgi:AcrR family transcriptional regulator
MNEKKLEIVKKVYELYRQFGIRSVTMDDVVRELGISKKTLYKHFKDKTDMVLAVMEYDFETKKEEYIKCFGAQLNAVEELINYSILQLKIIMDHKPTLIYDLKKYYPAVFDHFNKLKRENMYNGLLMNLERGKKEGLYRSDLNVELIARLNIVRVEGMMNSKIFKPEEIRSHEFFKELMKYHAYGIVSEKGRKVLESNIDKLK